MVGLFEQFDRKILERWRIRITSRSMSASSLSWACPTVERSTILIYVCGSLHGWTTINKAPVKRSTVRGSVFSFDPAELWQRRPVTCYLTYVTYHWRRRLALACFHFWLIRLSIPYIPLYQRYHQFRLKLLTKFSCESLPFFCGAPQRV